jgi:hypothetical protein
VFDGILQDGRVVVAGDADMPRSPGLFRFDERFQRSSGRFYGVDVLLRAHVVDLPEV